MKSNSPGHVGESTQAALQHLPWPSDLQTSVLLPPWTLRSTIDRVVSLHPFPCLRLMKFPTINTGKGWEN